ncbi:MAG: glycosyltransferase family A protein [Microbacterium sp.]
MVKVSIVVPTYCSGEHLDDLVASVDAQTMPQHDIEVLLIDDGSPDDTYARLEGFARTRPNYRAFRLPPSGWPSRPRNHGIDEARGEYVVFVDHDDRLFPDALRAAYALASRARADVLDGKESKSNTPGWAMRDLDADVENAIDWVEPHPLLPMNPHKMFRTQFLREKGIRFPEGGRQIWEDIWFDIAAHARAEVVSLMVETPFYYWNRPRKATTSATFQDDLDEYLAAIERVFDWVDQELAQERFAQLHPRFLAYQLRMRVLPLFSDANRPEVERERIRQFTARLLPRVAMDADGHLDPWRRIKVALLRAGRFDLVDLHEPTVPRLRCASTALDPAWEADGLHARVQLDWRLRRGDGSNAVVVDAGRARLRLHPDVARFAAEHGLDDDVTDGLAETSWSLERRSRAEKIDWAIARGCRPAMVTELGEGDDVPLMSDVVAMRWDPSADSQVAGAWDFHVRTVVLWTRVVRAVRTAIPAARWAAAGGTIAAVYRSRDGNLAVDVGQRVLNVLDAALPHPRAQRERGGLALIVPLPHVVVRSSLVVAVRLVDARGDEVGTGELRAGAAGAAIHAVAPAGVAFAIAVGDGIPSRTRLRLDTRGRVRVIPPPRPSLAQRAWARVPASTRRRIWLWRHGRLR